VKTNRDNNVTDAATTPLATQYNRRILIVDDNESIHEDFRKVLIQTKTEDLIALDQLEETLFGEASDAQKKDHDSIEYQLESAFQGEEALKMVENAQADNAPYAMVFMDVRMPPGWDGIETIKNIWKQHPHLEMVLCTAYSDYSWEDIIATLGNSDKLLFLRKPFDAIAVKQMALSLVKKWNLGEQARHHVQLLEQNVQQRTQQLEELLIELETNNKALAKSNEQLKHAVLHDALTTLPNRILFHDRLNQAIKMAERNQTQFCVALLDLNDFKTINDKYGHLAGDLVLKTVSQRISDILRSSDTVARLGGDEFAFVLPSANEEPPQLIAEKIMTSFNAPITLENEGLDLYIKASIGISRYPQHGTHADQLINNADTAMYIAKRSPEDISIYNENTT
jgi:diguanylate cyclase (GGDEF)-like protein